MEVVQQPVHPKQELADDHQQSVELILAGIVDVRPYTVNLFQELPQTEYPACFL